MSTEFKIGEGDNGANENTQGEDYCSCGIGGPHTLKCVMERDGLCSVTVDFGISLEDLTGANRLGPKGDK